jgi:acetoin utilization deacetylase AcuC-like enzyme
MGFCLFGNVAIAAHYAIAKHGCQRVLVVDWDVHHGNGTQALVERAERWCGGRLVSALEGGYAPESVAKAVLVHLRALA